MRTISVRSTGLLIALLAGAASSAAPLCVTAPLATYVAAGFECEIDAAVFSNFSFLGTGSITTAALTAAQIEVTPLSGSDQVGLRFSGRFESTGAADGDGPAAGNLAVTYRIIYDVDRPGSEFIAATTVIYDPVRFSPNLLKFGGVVVGKHIANDGATAITNDVDPDLMEMTFLFNPRQMVIVDDLVTLIGGASAEGTTEPPGFVTLSAFDNVLDYQAIIPEPATLSLLAVAGVAFVILRRRRRG